jgi:hypothetical protein
MAVLLDGKTTFFGQEAFEALEKAHQERPQLSQEKIDILAKAFEPYAPKRSKEP